MKVLTKLIVLPIIFFLATAMFVWPNASNLSASVDKEAIKSGVLMEYNTGKILYEQDSLEHLPIASVTKLMTLLLTFEALERGEITLDEKLIASENSAGMGGSQVFIDAGAEYTVLQLLQAIIISSANDASVMMAERLGGSEQNFVKMMNERMQQLGGKDTNYLNATGLPNASAFSCANDVALCMRAVLDFPLYYEICGIWMMNFEHPSGRITQMANTNKLLRTYSGCDAGKTGSTSEAGFCLSTTAKRGDMRLIAVVLGATDSKTRFRESANLLDYGFENFVTCSVLDSSTELDIDVNIRNSRNLPHVRAERSFDTVGQRGEEKQYSIDYELDSLSAPLRAGDIVGRAIILDDGVVVATINLILLNDVQQKSLWDNFRTIANRW